MTTSKFLINLGAKIREFRLKKDMTQIELATLCNFEKASMSRIESGKTNMTVLTLIKISKVLDVEIIEFFRNHNQ
jgi:transcriptional regulator with XRE-family HTH domain